MLAKNFGYQDDLIRKKGMTIQAYINSDPRVKNESTKLMSLTDYKSPREEAGKGRSTDTVEHPDGPRDEINKIEKTQIISEICKLKNQITGGSGNG